MCSASSRARWRSPLSCWPGDRTLVMPPFVWMIALPLASAPVIYLAGRWSARPALSRWLALAVLLATGVPFVLGAQSLVAAGPAVWHVESVTLRFDGISQLMVVLALALGAAAVIVSGAVMRGEEGEEKYYALLAAMLGALL